MCVCEHVCERVGRCDECAHSEICLETAQGVWVAAEVSVSDCPDGSENHTQLSARRPALRLLYLMFCVSYIFGMVFQLCSRLSDLDCKQ